MFWNVAFWNFGLPWRREFVSNRIVLCGIHSICFSSDNQVNFWDKWELFQLEFWGKFFCWHRDKERRCHSLKWMSVCQSINARNEGNTPLQHLLPVKRSLWIFLVSWLDVVVTIQQEVPLLMTDKHTSIFHSHSTMLWTMMMMF